MRVENAVFTSPNGNDVSDILSILALAISFFAFLFTLYQYREEKKESRLNFWFRDILIPHVHDPLQLLMYYCLDVCDESKADQ